jgi:hypothetical protein
MLVWPSRETAYEGSIKEEENMIRGKSWIRSGALILIAFSLCLSACKKNGDDDPDTYSLSGTISKTGVADGTYAYAKLVAGPGGGSTATILYSAKSSAFSSGSATYSVVGIEEGTYTGWVFIDVDGDGSVTLSPDSGDYYASADVTVNANKTFDIPNSAWTKY